MGKIVLYLALMSAFFVGSTKADDYDATVDKPASLTLEYEARDVSLVGNLESYLIIEMSVVEYQKTLPCRVVVFVEALTSNAKKVVGNGSFSLYFNDRTFVAQNESERISYLIQVDKANIRELLDNRIILKTRLSPVQEGPCDARMRFAQPQVWKRGRSGP